MDHRRFQNTLAGKPSPVGEPVSQPITDHNLLRRGRRLEPKRVQHRPLPETPDLLRTHPPGPDIPELLIKPAEETIPYIPDLREELRLILRRKVLLPPGPHERHRPGILKPVLFVLQQGGKMLRDDPARDADKGLLPAPHRRTPAAGTGSSNRSDIRSWEATETSAAPPSHSGSG